MITEHTGDLFTDAPADASLVHCVSADLRMGRGIAVEFRKRFGQVDALRDQDPKPGTVLVLRDGARFVFYLVTKDRAWDKPTAHTLSTALDALRAACEGLGVHTLAMPRLGCGLDKMQWSRVRKMLEDTFQPASIVQAIHVYSLDKV